MSGVIKSADLFADADYYEVPEEINVRTWYPTPDASGPPKQVHLHFGKSPGPIFAVRFKGPRGLDRMIDALISHREEVWGKR